LDKARLYCKPSKCLFLKQELLYIGYILRDGGISSDPAKVEAIVSAPPPDSSTALGRFVGMCGFHSRLVPDYSALVRPLTQLQKVTQRWGPHTWTPAADASFKKLKDAIAASVTCRVFDPNLPCQVVCDASITRLAYALYQVDPLDNLAHPVSFGSRMLNEAQRAYPIHELELMSVVEAVERFRLWLIACPGCTVYTDSSAVSYWSTQMLCAQKPKIIRRLMELSQVHLTIHKIRGADNYVADYLSRLPVNHLPSAITAERIHGTSAGATISSLTPAATVISSLCCAPVHVPAGRVTRSRATANVAPPVLRDPHAIPHAPPHAHPISAPRRPKAALRPDDDYDGDSESPAEDSQAAARVLPYNLRSRATASSRPTVGGPSYGLRPRPGRPQPAPPAFVPPPLGLPALDDSDFSESSDDPDASDDSDEFDPPVPPPRSTPYVISPAFIQAYALCPQFKEWAGTGGRGVDLLYPLHLNDGILFRGPQVCVPTPFRMEVLHSIHEQVGHKNA
jgi:hypothetical protein